MSEDSKSGKYSDAIAKKIVASIDLGNFRETAAVAAGISARTLREWMKRGANGEEPFASFAAEMDAAEARAEESDVRLIGEAGKSDWKAVAWRLERKAPKKWGFRVRVEVREEIDAFLEAIGQAVTPEVYETVLRAYNESVGSATLGGTTSSEDVERRSGGGDGST